MASRVCRALRPSLLEMRRGSYVDRRKRLRSYRTHRSRTHRPLDRVDSCGWPRRRPDSTPGKSRLFGRPRMRSRRKTASHRRSPRPRRRRRRWWCMCCEHIRQADMAPGWWPPPACTRQPSHSTHLHHHQREEGGAGSHRPACRWQVVPRVRQGSVSSEPGSSWANFVCDWKRGEDIRVLGSERALAPHTPIVGDSAALPHCRPRSASALPRVRTISDSRAITVIYLCQSEVLGSSTENAARPSRTRP